MVTVVGIICWVREIYPRWIRSRDHRSTGAMAAEGAAFQIDTNTINKICDTTVSVVEGTANHV